jgi:lysophospholipase L1-like esterase
MSPAISRLLGQALALLAVVACQPQGESERRQPAGDAGASAADDAGELGLDAQIARDATGVDARAFDPTPLLDRRIFDLTREEGREVLRYGAGESGDCAGVGVGERTVQRCAYAQLLCSKKPSAAVPPPLDWPSAAPFKPGCSATVRQYLACQDGITRLGCERAGSNLAAPPSEACLAFERVCPTLDFQAPPPAVSTACPEQGHDDGRDIHGFDGCRPKPARLIALGDSIATCTLVPNSAPCAPDLLADYLRTKYAPELRFESYALHGTRTADLREQASYVAPGPGHLLVWVFSGGNDLMDCSHPSVDMTRACVDALVEKVPSQWQALFAYFTDRTRFPDGATFVLNTQYSLHDGCHHSLGSPGFVEQQILRFNQAAELAPADARSDTIAIDQFPEWLGHARNAADAGCPHFDANDHDAWLFFDGIHPNELGQCQIAAKAQVALDRMYGCAL